MYIWTDIKMASSISLLYYTITILLSFNLVIDISPNLLSPHHDQEVSIISTASAFSVGRFGWPGLEWREIIDWWTSGYSRGVVIGRNYIPPCKLCDMPRMFRVDK